jgi:hypothetical protein
MPAFFRSFSAQLSGRRLDHGDRAFYASGTSLALRRYGHNKIISSV